MFLVISGSFVLELSTLHMPISNAAWLKVALVLPVKTFFNERVPLRSSTSTLDVNSLEEFFFWDMPHRWSSFIVGEIALIEYRIFITRSVVTLDRYVLSFFRIFSSGLSTLILVFLRESKTFFLIFMIMMFA